MNTLPHISVVVTDILTDYLVHMSEERSKSYFCSKVKIILFADFTKNKKLFENNI